MVVSFIYRCKRIYTPPNILLWIRTFVLHRTPIKRWYSPLPRKRRRQLSSRRRRSRWSWIRREKKKKEKNVSDARRWSFSSWAPCSWQTEHPSCTCCARASAAVDTRANVSIVALTPADTTNKRSFPAEKRPDSNQQPADYLLVKVSLTDNPPTPARSDHDVGKTSC